jgi:general secretion pathway protein H
LVNTSNNRRRSIAGFTLLELLVVLAIAGLLLALVPPAVSAVVPGAKLKVAARELAVTFRDARNQAIHRNTTVDMTFELEPARYEIADGTPHLFSDGIQIAILDNNATMSTQSFPSLDIRPGEKYRLRFYPDGSSSGAAVKVANRDTYYVVGVGWLMGRVTVSEARDSAM